MTTTLGLMEFKQSFQFLKLGEGAALSVLLLVMLAVCGLIAGALIVFSGLRLSISSRAVSQDGRGRSKTLPVLGLILALLLLLPACLLSILPVFWTVRMAMRGVLLTWERCASQAHLCLPFAVSASN